MSQTNYSNEDLFLSTTQVCRRYFFSCEPPVIFHLIRQITSCKFPGLVLALTSVAWSRDSRPKQEILDDLLEQARQVRSNSKAWGDLLSVQARQHQEKDSLDHQQPGENANEDVSFPAIVGTKFMCNLASSNFVGSNLLRGNLAGGRSGQMGRTW